MKIAKQLDRASSFFFFFGFTFSKLHLFPIPVAALTLHIISLVSYILGYIIWILACKLYPTHHPKADQWYGFSQFKYQWLYAALLGMLAITCCFTAAFFPVAIIPANWIFALSHGLWFIGEFHKYKHPPSYDPHYSKKQQGLYLVYASFMLSAGVISAIATTLAIAFPPCAVIVFPTSALICILVGLLGINFWVKSQLYPHSPDIVDNNDPDVGPTLTQNTKPRPYLNPTPSAPQLSKPPAPTYSLADLPIIFRQMRKIQSTPTLEPYNAYGTNSSNPP